MQIDIAKLETFAEAQARRSRQFQSVESFRWFTRRHHDELVAAGAMLIIARRPWINPQPFDQVVASVGLAQARAIA